MPDGAARECIVTDNSYPRENDSEYRVNLGRATDVKVELQLGTLSVCSKWTKYARTTRQSEPPMKLTRDTPLHDHDVSECFMLRRARSARNLLVVPRIKGKPRRML